MNNEADSLPSGQEKSLGPVIISNETIITYALPIFSLVAISIIVYGIFVGKLGFYWDDWPLVWVYKSMGVKGLHSYFSGNRPGAGLLYTLIFPYLGISSIRWHLTALFLRFFCSALIYILFRTLWPKRAGTSWLISVFLLLYPGFTQQSMAITYIPQYVSLLFYSISLTGTILSIRLTRYWLLFTVISVVTALLGYLVIEYFAGLELLRPLIILMTLRGDHHPRVSIRIRDVLVKYCPYAIGFLLYVVWRIFIFKSGAPSYDGVSILSNLKPSDLLIRLAGLIENILKATFVAWARVIDPGIFNLGDRFVQISWVSGILVAFISVITLRVLKYWSNGTEEITSTAYDRRLSIPIIVLGIIALIVGALPLMYQGSIISYRIESFLDRYTLSFMLGASLLLAGLLLGYRCTSMQKAILASIILLLFSSFQVRNEGIYRDEWLKQKAFLWQFAWRLPSMKQGTSVFVDYIPFTIAHDHSAGLMNLLYNSDDSAGRLNYFIFDLDWLTSPGFNKSKMTSISVPAFKTGEPVEGSLRHFPFYGSTSQSVVVLNSPSGTIRIVDSRYVDEIPCLSPSIRSVANISNIAKVVEKKDGVPRGCLLSLFGPEPQHGWPYFYQKAELERQFGSWDKVAGLGDKARDMGLKPNDPSEWFPFIEGYAKIGKYEVAIKLTEGALAESPSILIALSNMWRRILHAEGAGSTNYRKVLDALGSKLILSEQGLGSE